MTTLDDLLSAADEPGPDRRRGWQCAMAATGLVVIAVCIALLAHLVWN